MSLEPAPVATSQVMRFRPEFWSVTSRQMIGRFQVGQEKRSVMRRPAADQRRTELQQQIEDESWDGALLCP